ncbi:phosphohistidine phosphatase SixA [Halomonas caseinilytica]|uniref:Phosphohistidine phosphatase, SixA n=1 Tax=Halomonas caseinilytica TaxID=438744 RepID=A0A1M6T191_9GAMM|nr:phosphohistidine phosphatase SixA [Halomonas caseinilytica]SEM62819.1 phosphohistidine phosphatase, SixA [Halomonas caseinilytica]SHK50697.1 phosphohistidine phosphatase, SixA [Halomonas caseinilytica]
MAETLLIMRHGEAGAGSPDAARELTPRGHREATRMATWLAGRDDLELSRLRLLASPYQRAQQTAAHIAEALGLTVEPLSLITPDDPPGAVLDWLLEASPEAPVMLVSHMPLVGALTGLLVEGRSDHGLGLPTAAIAELEAEVPAAGCARLTRFTTPDDLPDPGVSRP